MMWETVARTQETQLGGRRFEGRWEVAFGEIP